jgi:hypothetical protein
MPDFDNTNRGDDAGVPCAPDKGERGVSEFVDQLTAIADGYPPIDLTFPESSRALRDMAREPDIELIALLWRSRKNPNRVSYHWVKHPEIGGSGSANVSCVVALWLNPPKRSGFDASWRIINTPNGPGLETIYERVFDDGTHETRGVACCADCGVNTIKIGEWYMIRDDVWEQAWPGTANFADAEHGQGNYLCVGCLEKRLGRELNSSDFLDGGRHIMMQRGRKPSRRLRDRIRKPACEFCAPAADDQAAALGLVEGKSL